MSVDNTQRQKRHNSEYEKMFVTSSAAGLAHSHNLIRTEKSIEVQFAKLCSQIHLDDYRKIRSDKQRDDRQLKRSQRSCSTIKE
jgi:hypothetical protein